MYGAAADVVVVLHLAFIVFVVLGGLLVVRRPALAWLHLPAAAWGVAIEFLGWICPLTPLENHLRALAGEQAYGGGFIERYLMPVLYPASLTPPSQWLLGALVLSINVGIYMAVIRRARRRRKRSRF